MAARVGKYLLFETLGEGAFGKVKLGVHEDTGEQVAVKVMDKSDIKAQEMTMNVRREIAIMKALKHKNIVNLRHVLTSATKLYVVMDLVTGGELFTKILNEGKLPEAIARRFFQQLIDGPENLLIDDTNGELKITDFGLSAMKGASTTEELLHTQCGSPNYCAPEIISRAKQGYSGPLVDAWSCGIILFALLAGYLPFYDENTKALYRMIQRSDVVFPRSFPRGARLLVERLLHKDPERRLKLADVKRDPWFVIDYEGDAARPADGAESPATAGTGPNRGRGSRRKRPKRRPDEQPPSNSVDGMPMTAGGSSGGSVNAPPPLQPRPGSDSLQSSAAEAEASTAASRAEADAPAATVAAAAAGAAASVAVAAAVVEPPAPVHESPTPTVAPSVADPPSALAASVSVPAGHAGVAVGPTAVAASLEGQPPTVLASQSRDEPGVPDAPVVQSSPAYLAPVPEATPVVFSGVHEAGPAEEADAAPVPMATVAECAVQSELADDGVRKEADTSTAAVETQGQLWQPRSTAPQVVVIPNSSTAARELSPVTPADARNSLLLSFASSKDTSQSARALADSVDADEEQSAGPSGVQTDGRAASSSPPGRPLPDRYPQPNFSASLSTKTMEPPLVTQTNDDANALELRSVFAAVVGGRHDAVLRRASDASASDGAVPRTEQSSLPYWAQKQLTPVHRTSSPVPPTNASREPERVEEHDAGFPRRRSAADVGSAVDAGAIFGVHLSRRSSEPGESPSLPADSSVSRDFAEPVATERSSSLAGLPSTVSVGATDDGPPEEPAAEVSAPVVEPESVAIPPVSAPSVSVPSVTAPSVTVPPEAVRPPRTVPPVTVVEAAPALPSRIEQARRLFESTASVVQAPSDDHTIRQPVSPLIYAPAVLPALSARWPPLSSADAVDSSLPTSASRSGSGARGLEDEINRIGADTSHDRAGPDKGTDNLGVPARRDGAVSRVAGDPSGSVDGAVPVGAADTVDGAEPSREGELALGADPSTDTPSPEELGGAVEPTSLGREQSLANGSETGVAPLGPTAGFSLAAAEADLARHSSKPIAQATLPLYPMNDFEDAEAAMEEEDLATAAAGLGLPFPVPVDSEAVPAENSRAPEESASGEPVLAAHQATDGGVPAALSSRSPPGEGVDAELHREDPASSSADQLRGEAPDAHDSDAEVPQHPDDESLSLPALRIKQAVQRYQKLFQLEKGVGILASPSFKSRAANARNQKQFGRLAAFEGVLPVEPQDEAAEAASLAVSTETLQLYRDAKSVTGMWGILLMQEGIGRKRAASGPIFMTPEEKPSITVEEVAAFERLLDFWQRQRDRDYTLDDITPLPDDEAASLRALLATLKPPPADDVGEAVEIVDADEAEALLSHQQDVVDQTGDADAVPDEPGLVRTEAGTAGGGDSFRSHASHEDGDYHRTDSDNRSVGDGKAAVLGLGMKHSTTSDEITPSDAPDSVGKRSGSAPQLQPGDDVSPKTSTDINGVGALPSMALSSSADAGKRPSKHSRHGSQGSGMFSSRSGSNQGSGKAGAQAHAALPSDKSAEALDTLALAKSGSGPSGDAASSASASEAGMKSGMSYGSVSSGVGGAQQAAGSSSAAAPVARSRWGFRGMFGLLTGTAAVTPPPVPVAPMTEFKSALPPEKCALILGRVLTSMQCNVMMKKGESKVRAEYPMKRGEKMLVSVSAHRDVHAGETVISFKRSRRDRSRGTGTTEFSDFVAQVHTNFRRATGGGGGGGGSGRR
ncbi:hypothetical protein MMPV_006054 [Pyropia vietnamensis]